MAGARAETLSSAPSIAGLRVEFAGEAPREDTRDAMFHWAFREHPAAKWLPIKVFRRENRATPGVAGFAGEDIHPGNVRLGRQAGVSAGGAL